MTGDGPLGYYLHKVYGTKWFSSRHRKWKPAAASRRSSTATRAWSTPGSGPSAWSGTCWSQDPWRVVMSTDHPNGGSFLAYPQIIRLLMDRTYRQDVLQDRAPAGRASARCWPIWTASTR